MKRASSVRFIRDAFTRPERVFTDRSFKICAMEAWLAKHNEPDARNFHTSNGLVYDFKRSNGLCSRRAHVRHRSTMEAAADETWRQMIEKLIGTRNRGRIFNVDETF
jgi:hypothetical protein